MRLSQKANDIRKREADAIELWTAGYEQVEIAEILGYADHSAISHLIARVLERQTNRTLEDGKAKRTQELDDQRKRLHKLIAGIRESAEAGDLEAIKAQVKVEETFLKLADRQAKLEGHDAPAKQDIKLSTEERDKEVLQWLDQAVNEKKRENSEVNDSRDEL